MDPCDFEVEVKLIIKAKNTEEHTPALGKGIVSPVSYTHLDVYKRQALSSG